ncbi:MAG: hypothetical protein KAT28_04925 [Candidatus Aenigmarchaeota archaeon]|nr:hypothetical protein [Candidatus Aenigmarchaeota archaeon]
MVKEEEIVGFWKETYEMSMKNEDYLDAVVIAKEHRLDENLVKKAGGRLYERQMKNKYYEFAAQTAKEYLNKDLMKKAGLIAFKEEVKGKSHDHAIWIAEEYEIDRTVIKDTIRVLAKLHPKMDITKYYELINREI